MNDRTANEGIATLRLIASLPGGGEKPVELVLCRSYEVSTGEWECRFSIVGLYDDWPPARAANSWRALILASNFLHMLLDGIIVHGGSIRDPINGKAGGPR
jgi:hypothetical protein